jgi:amidase
MEAPAYQEISRRKLVALDAGIPFAWRLPADLIAASASNDVDVMDVPNSCGLLDRRQLEITEKWDVQGLWGEMVAGRLDAKEVIEAFCKVSYIVIFFRRIFTSIREAFLLTKPFFSSAQRYLTS